jgi:hypothetical protein
VLSAMTTFVSASSGIIVHVPCTSKRRAHTGVCFHAPHTSDRQECRVSSTLKYSINACARNNTHPHALAAHSHSRLMREPHTPDKHTHPYTHTIMSMLLCSVNRVT